MFIITTWDVAHVGDPNPFRRIEAHDIGGHWYVSAPVEQVIDNGPVPGVYVVWDSVLHNQRIPLSVHAELRKRISKDDRVAWCMMAKKMPRIVLVRVSDRVNLNLFRQNLIAKHPGIVFDVRLYPITDGTPRGPYVADPQYLEIVKELEAKYRKENN